jgi:hypothetical protein
MRVVVAVVVLSFVSSVSVVGVFGGFSWKRFVRSFVSGLLFGCLLFWFVLPDGAGAKPSSTPFGIEPGSFHFVSGSGQAGAHSDWVLSFNFGHESDGATFNDVRSIVNEFPAGFDASDTAVPTCTEAQLLAKNPLGPEGYLPDCPVASQVGQITSEVFIAKNTPDLVTFPVYNMEVDNYGTTAEVGYNAVGLFTLISQAVVRSTDEGLTAVTSNVPKVGEAHDITVTLWGVPAAAEHDVQRGEVCGTDGERPPLCHNELGGPQEARVPVKPFLSNPTSCTGPFIATVRAESWEEPLQSQAEWPSASTETAPVTGCDRVPFEPSIEVEPGTVSAETSTGLNVSLIVPQSWENPFTISTSNLRDTTVALPEGMTANPSLAAGLGACTPEQYALETFSSPPGAGCPEESKIGSIEIETPVLAEKIQGAVYIATPYDNVPAFGDAQHPGGSLLALYVVAKDPPRGIMIKVAGKIVPNLVTGQLVTTFENTPQQPFSKFTLKFRPGATAPLVSPPECGTYTTRGSLTPWSGEEHGELISPPQPVSSSFQITEGVHEGACPSGGVLPFKPAVVSGTENNAGGSYSPFYLRLTREDGEQELVKFSTTLPPGLTGNLTGIPFCPNIDIEAAKQATGAQEEAEPSCPASSEIGRTIVEAGVGTVLAQTPGKVYLAGPYNGAPLSIVSITSAKVGPFDLGTVVIRFALNVNPLTAQVEISGTQSDPIPHIIDGIVVHVRNIHVYVERPKFILNPTNCAPQSIKLAVTGSGSNYAVPADQDTVSTTSPFQAADCASLTFKPSLKATTSGKTSRAHGASLTVKLTYPNKPQGTQANIAKVKVDLPKQLPSRLTTLQKACVDRTFNANPALCPKASIVGYAKAITPILPVPLEGPAYFVSHGGAKFPELIIVLQGYNITIDLHGETFINKQGITSSTFNTVPDQPVTSFELTLPQGPDSALAANGNLCTAKLTMPTAYTAQNNTETHTTTTIHPTNCPTPKHKTHTTHKTHATHKKHTKK